MWRELRILFGIPDLKTECVRRVESEYGKETVDDFIRLHDDINSGTPVSFIEAVAMIDIVEKTKKDLRDRTLFRRIMKKFSKENRQ